MKLADFPLLKVITKAIGGITPVKRLKRVLNTRLYSNALYLMLNTALMGFLGFFFWILVARFYTETEVGFSSAIISVVGLLASFSQLGLGISIVRFLPQTERPQDLINTCLTLGGILSLTAAAIFLAGINLWTPRMSFIAQNPAFTLVFVVFTLTWVLSKLTDSAFLAKRRTEFTLYKQVVYSLVKLPLPLLFVLFFHAFGIVASWTIATGISLILSIFLFLPRIQSDYRPVPTLKLALLKRMWRYSGGNYLANLISGTPILLLPVMVVNLINPESNAYFYVSMMLAGFLFAIPGAVSSSLFAEGSHFESKLKENTIRSLKFIALLLLPATIVMVFAGKWLLLLFGESYSVNALSLLQILAISSLPFAISSIYSTLLRVNNRIRELVLIWGLASIAVLVASYLLMPLYGIIGVGYAWLGTKSLLAIYAIARRASVL